MGETHSNVGQQLVTSCRKFKNIQRCTTVQFPKQFSHSSLCSFGVQGPSITGQDCGRDRLSPISCTQFKIRIAQHDSPVPKQFSHSSLCFFGGPCLSITDQDCGRDFMGEANSNLSQPFVTHLLYTIQNPYSSARRSSFRNSFHTFLFVFWWTTS